ncbi:MAG: undecaprenyl-diphosphate phosphatase [Clostridia bacterium]|jgi:undecaprenyl-diphosphatase|nr:undecaprenyl-diphosphate phosphatase [Clostridia bacterium]MDD4408759.1 undecaprenyl-diphosphate phosphatase [Clostridia bacterium]
MTLWIAIIYGIIQGITEFLPVSSSGHLVLLNSIFKVEGNFIIFSLLLHLATLFAVFFVLRKEIFYLFKNPFDKKAMNLYIATIPTIIIALCFIDFFESSFSGAILPTCFMITATLLFIVEIFKKTQYKRINKKSAIIMGIAQGIAILPGISRSGATIAAGLLCGGKRKEVSSFSFLMSIPIIFASMIYEIYSCITKGIPIFDTPVLPTIFAFLFAFFVGIICVKFMINMLHKVKLYYFSIYLVIISILSFYIISF